MNSDLNSDLNSAQNSALHQVRSCALRAHGVRSRAHNSQVACMSRARPAQVAHSACAGRVHSAQVVGASCDLLPLPIPRPGHDVVSRSRPPGRLNQVATSIPCRDLPSTQPKQPRSRPQKNGVATPISIGEPESGRDIKLMLRHQMSSAPPCDTKNRSPSLRPAAVEPGHDATSWS